MPTEPPICQNCYPHPAHLPHPCDEGCGCGIVELKKHVDPNSDDVSCDSCGKTAEYGEPPIGWWDLNVVRSTSDDEGESSNCVVCSPTCAKTWLENWENE